MFKVDRSVSQAERLAPWWLALCLGIVLALAPASTTAAARELGEDEGAAELFGTQDTADIQAVISGQLAAFAAREHEAAFGFADPSVQLVFRTPEGFASLVRTYYTPIYNNVGHDFLRLSLRADEATQFVRVTSRTGQVAIAEYRLARYADGWRITTVLMQRLPAATPDARIGPAAREEGDNGG